MSVYVLHPLPVPYHHNLFVFRAGIEPGILAWEAGALPRRLKGSEIYTQQPLLGYIRYIRNTLPYGNAAPGGHPDRNS